MVTLVKAFREINADSQILCVALKDESSIELAAAVQIIAEDSTLLMGPMVMVLLIRSYYPFDLSEVATISAFVLNVLLAEKSFLMEH